MLVTASVQRQTAGLFVVEDGGAHDLKGLPAPVALYRIVRASGGGRRGGGRALTPLVGREEELALLTRRWSRALAGEGQFVQIVGEPGIGKSRLLEEFRGKLAETPHTWVEWAASQLLQNTPLLQLTIEAVDCATMAILPRDDYRLRMNDPEVNSALFEGATRALALTIDHMMMIGRSSAEERLAWFLTNARGAFWRLARPCARIGNAAAGYRRLSWTVDRNGQPHVHPLQRSRANQPAP